MQRKTAKSKNMPIVMPIEVQIPPIYNANQELLREQISRYAQALVDNMAANSLPHRHMTAAQVAANSLSVDEAEARVDALINAFYSVKA